MFLKRCIFQCKEDEQLFVSCLYFKAQKLNALETEPEVILALTYI
jgi:hypothetical protein